MARNRKTVLLKIPKIGGGLTKRNVARSRIEAIKAKRMRRESTNESQGIHQNEMPLNPVVVVDGFSIGLPSLSERDSE